MIFSEQCRVGRAVAQNKALETRLRERRRRKARDAGRCPGTRGALLPTFSQRLFLIKYMGGKSCKLRLVLKSIQWGGQEEVTSHRYQQGNDAAVIQGGDGAIKHRRYEEAEPGASVEEEAEG